MPPPVQLGEPLPLRWHRCQSRFAPRQHYCKFEKELRSSKGGKRRNHHQIVCIHRLSKLIGAARTITLGKMIPVETVNGLLFLSAAISEFANIKVSYECFLITDNGNARMTETWPQSGKDYAWSWRHSNAIRVYVGNTRVCRLSGPI